jgi:hypothetical protein
MKPLAIERKAQHHPDDIRAHFQRFQETIERFGVQKDDLYNFDETGFRIGVGRAHTVICKRRKGHNHRLYLNDPDNREMITCVETICADGSSIPPMVILSAIIHQEKWYTNLPGDYLIGVSDTGYSNDVLNLDYIRHFDKYTKQKTKGAYRLLISDGYNSHLEFSFIRYY